MEDRTMSEVTMMGKIDGCSSRYMPRLVEECRRELNSACIERILNKTISMDLIFVLRKLDKHALLRKEYVNLVRDRVPKGYRAEIDRIEAGL